MTEEQCDSALGRTCRLIERECSWTTVPTCCWPVAGDGIAATSRDGRSRAFVAVVPRRMGTGCRRTASEYHTDLLLLSPETPR